MNFQWKKQRERTSRSCKSAAAEVLRNVGQTCRRRQYNHHHQHQPFAAQVLLIRARGCLLDFSVYHNEKKIQLPKIETNVFTDKINAYVKSCDVPMLFIFGHKI